MTFEGVTATFPEFEQSMQSLIRIFQVIGGILGIYVIYWIVNTFINNRRIKVLKRILQNVEEINKKLDKKNKK